MAAYMVAEVTGSTWITQSSPITSRRALKSAAPGGGQAFDIDVRYACTRSTVDAVAITIFEPDCWVPDLSGAPGPIVTPVDHVSSGPTALNGNQLLQTSSAWRGD